MATNRIVTAEVMGEHMALSSALAGAVGSHNAVTLEFSFDSAWEGTTRKVYFTDALGRQSVYVLLTTNLLKMGTADVWQVPIPSEATAEPGEMTVTIRGVTLAADGTTVDRVILTAQARMLVISSGTVEDAEEPEDVTATVAEQLQAEIDAIIDDVAEAAKAANAREEAQAAALAAQEAQAGAEEAQAAAEAAAASAKDSADSAQDAMKGAEAARQAVEDLTVTAETGAAYSEASVAKTTDESGAVTLHFTIPRGDTGEAGADGVTPTFYIDENGHLIAIYE